MQVLTLFGVFRIKKQKYIMKITINKIFTVALFSFLILQGTLIIRNSSAQWVQVNNGMGNQSINSLAVSGNNIFAGTFNNAPYQGVYKSTDNGTTWTQTSLNYGNVVSLAATGNNIFAGMGYPQNSGVYKSTDNGSTWTQTIINNGAGFVLLADGNNIFAGIGGVNKGVWLSTDNGTTWTQTSLNNQSVHSLAVIGNNVFAGTYLSGVYLSTDNGSSWLQTSLNNQNIWSLAANGNNIFAGTYNPDNGVYLSTNNGNTWTQTSLNNITVSSIATSGNMVFASTPNGVYVSYDNGTNWIKKNEGIIGAISVNAFCILNDYIFAGTSFGVYKRPLGELITGIQPISNEIPGKFSLSQNYPNPFNPTTKIKFSLPNDTFTNLVIYDATGRELQSLVSEQLNAGTYEVVWSANKYSSGVYYYKLTAGNFSSTNKMILLK
jgi:photosystem II stability/assembly factor-like uncharacterized protein